MNQCPNCGQPVREGQRFCGNCGADVLAVFAPAPNMVDDRTASQYAYPQSQSYGYQLPPDPEASSNSRRLIIAAAFIIAICCAFALGCLIGFEVPTMMGVPIGPSTGPTPRPTPTPASLNPIPSAVIFALAWIGNHFLISS